MSKLRIALDARPFGGVPNGYTTYIRSILAALSKSGLFDITLLTNQPHNPLFDLGAYTTVVLPGNSSWRWEQRTLPTHLEVAQYDVYFAGSNRGIPLKKHPSTTYILGLLDVIPFLFPRLYIWRFPFHFIRHELLPQLLSVWKSDQIVTISQASAKDIKRFFPRKNVTPLLIILDGLTAKPQKPKKQFTYINGNDPRKKIDTLLRAFEIFHRKHPDYQLVLIGKGYDVFDGLISELGIQGAVIKTGYLSQADKVQTMAESQAIVYPSLYEGYGLAIAEAFLANVPIISGRGGSQAEIGGDAAVYISPEDAEAIAAAMESMLDSAVREEQIKLGGQQLVKLQAPEIEARAVAYFAKLAKRNKVIG